MSAGPRFFYNVYDNGELFLENVRRKDILDKLGSVPGSITNYVERKHIFLGRYTFKYGECPRGKSETLLYLEKEWEDAVKPFKKVIWVKSGGRKLKVRGKK